jgi:hypothetical protein
VDSLLALIVATDYNFRFNWQLELGKAKSLFCQVNVNSTDFEKDPTWVHNGNPVIERSFSATHTGLGRLLCYWLVWKHANPHLTFTLQATVDGNTASFDLASSDKFALHSLDSEIAKGYLMASARISLDWTAKYATAFNSFRF